VRVLCVCVLCVPIFWFSSSTSHTTKAQDVFTWLGLRFHGLLYASILPLLLTMILFIGPLTLHYLDGIFLLYADWNYWRSNLQNLIWIRNHIVGPLSEEFVFRACMLPILVPSLGENWSLILSPLFFGFAHVHHLMEKQRQGIDFKQAILGTVFQMSYTTVFGLYSAFLFLRTGHLIAPFLVHMFCNHMGFQTSLRYLHCDGQLATTWWQHLLVEFWLGLFCCCQWLTRPSTPMIYIITFK